MKMRRALYLFGTLCLICVFVGSNSAFAAENLDIISEIAASDVRESAEIGETVTIRDSIEFTIPADWVVADVYEDDGMTNVQFEGIDESGRKLWFLGGEADSEEAGMKFTSYSQLLNMYVEAGISHLVVSINGVDMILASQTDSIIGLILDKEGYFLLFGFELEGGYMSKLEESPKLRDDMIAILHSIHAVNPDKLLYFDRSTPEFKPVTFQDAEFERMCRDCMGKTANDPVYPTELAAIRELYIRTGKMSFLTKPRETKEYVQPCELGLADLRLFPNLRHLYVCDTVCAGFEALPELNSLRNLTLIRAGLTECSFLTDMTLSNLNVNFHDN